VEVLSPEEAIDRLVRVRLRTSDRHEPAVLSVTAPFKIEHAVTKAVLAEGHGAIHRVRVMPAAGTGIALGDEHIQANDIILIPKRDAALVVDKHTYRGSLRIQRAGDDLRLTNHVDVESYLRGVLRGELPRYFHPESFKAQAVAARTYVLYQKQRAPKDRTFDVRDDEGSQMYIGVRGEDRVAVEAVRETRGQACVWCDHGVDRLFCTYYSSACGGLTQHVNNVKRNDPAVPPLEGNVVCKDCYLAPHYRWKPVSLSKEEVTRRICKNYPSLRRLGTIVGLKPKSTTTDGRITNMELRGSSGEVGTLIGEDFRLSIGGHTLKSTNFRIGVNGDEFTFSEGKGFGHGIGLCQYGMETKARRGWRYERILATYYPGSKLKTLY
jgi:stage II sporulation protein D